MTGTGQCAAPGIAQGDIEDSDVPAKGIRLARRVAGLQQRQQAQRHMLEVIMLPDGTWLLIVNGSTSIEYLGRD